jgi:hypothetical protein
MLEPVSNESVSDMDERVKVRKHVTGTGGKERVIMHDVMVLSHQK